MIKKSEADGIGDIQFEPLSEEDLVSVWGGGEYGPNYGPGGGGGGGGNEIISNVANACCTGDSGQS